MGLVDKVKSIAGSGEGDGYDYECEQCGSAFTAERRNPDAVSCPDCGSERVYSPV